MERVIIIEDEQLAAEKLKMLIKKIAPSMEIVAVLATVKESVQWFFNNEADLIFLDINLADDISFKIFEQIEVDTPIIFVTAYDEYAIKAFKQNSLDYILKPIDEEELRRGIRKYQKLNSHKIGFGHKIESLIAQYLPSNNFKNRILVTYGGKSRSIDVSEVAYLYAYEKGVYLTSFSQSTYLTDETLDALETSLNPKNFYRINRKYIINIKAVCEIHKYSSRRLKVDLKPTPKFEALVPAEKITSFKKWLNS